MVTQHRTSDYVTFTKSHRGTNRKYHFSVPLAVAPSILWKLYDASHSSASLLKGQKKKRCDSGCCSFASVNPVECSTINCNLKRRRDYWGWNLLDTSSTHYLAQNKQTLSPSRHTIIHASIDNPSCETQSTATVTVHVQRPRIVELVSDSPTNNVCLRKCEKYAHRYEQFKYAVFNVGCLSICITC